MKKALKHFKTVCKHKWEVEKICFKCGLYKQGLLHDISVLRNIRKKTLRDIWLDIKN